MCPWLLRKEVPPTKSSRRANTKSKGSQHGSPSTTRRTRHHGPSYLSFLAFPPTAVATAHLQYKLHTASSPARGLRRDQAAVLYHKAQLTKHMRRRGADAKYPRHQGRARIPARAPSVRPPILPQQLTWSKSCTSSVRNMSSTSTSTAMRCSPSTTHQEDARVPSSFAPLAFLACCCLLRSRLYSNVL